MGKRIAKELYNGRFNYYKRGIYLGIVDNYDIAIKYDHASQLFNINLNVDGKDSIKKLNDLLKNIDDYAIARYRNPNLTITVACDRIKDIPNKFNKIIEITLDYLKKNKYKNICSKCGNSKNTSLVNIDSVISFYCDDCYDKAVKKYSLETQDKKKIKENILLGILGAVLGTIPGIIAWFVLAYLMINPTIMALLIMLGATYGYKWGAKAIKIPGLLITLAIGFIGVIFANEISMSYTLYNEYINQYNINIIDAYKAMPYYLNKIPTFKESHTQNLIISLIFGAFGGLSTLGVHRRYVAGNKIKKVEDAK